MNYDQIAALIGTEHENLLTHTCTTITKDKLILPSPGFLDKVFGMSDRSIPTLNSLSRIYNTGRLAGTGYLSILPVDQLSIRLSDIVELSIFI